MGVAERVSVPRLWPESTIVCLASGPSLTAEDVNYVRGKARVIAVKETLQLAPWADVLYACDGRFWDYHKGMPAFHGLKFGLQRRGWPDVQILEDTGIEGLEFYPTGLKTGKNSGYQAIGLAKHLGARTIVLLGYDMDRRPDGTQAFHSTMPYHRRTADQDYVAWQGHFKTLVAPLYALGITVINCSRETALTCFPRKALSEVLPVGELVC